MSKNAPGKSHRGGISLMELTEMFPDEAAATMWFESMVWPECRHCPHCGSCETVDVPPSKGQPYWCPDCRKGFSMRHGTALERSKAPLRKWVLAIYLEMTSLKGLSSMKLHRHLKVTQKTVWFMLHRIREAWSVEATALLFGPAEVDETYFGGSFRNMLKAKSKALTGRCTADNTAVVGGKDRERNEVVAHSDGGSTLKGFAWDHVEEGSTVYHKLYAKHLDRYVREFAGRHNVREADTVDQMAAAVTRMVGKRLMYRQLIVDNRLASGARS